MDKDEMLILLRSEFARNETFELNYFGLRTRAAQIAAEEFGKLPREQQLEVLRWLEEEAKQ